MSAATLFIERDGTLIEEPPECQLDSVTKVRFMPGVFAALGELALRRFRLVMVTNLDGSGSAAAFAAGQQFILEAFRSQGVEFDAVLSPGLLPNYLRDHAIDPERSAVIGHRNTDLHSAAYLEVRGFTVRRNGTPEETWPAVLHSLIARRAEVVRETAETRVAVRVNLDAEQPLKALTAIGFFDHMLEQLAKHAGVALELTAAGDLHVDEHHTVEDSALALGEALRRALGRKEGIARYGFLLPMDEAQAVVALDLSGRPYSEFQGRFPRSTVGTFPTELVPHFFRSLSNALGATIHINVRGENTHHMVEACFKGFGRALRQATRRDGTGIPSTKEVL